MNPVTLERLVANGSDLSRPHHIVNVFHVFQKSGVDALIAALEDLGFTIEDRGSPQHHANTEYWKIEASTDIVPRIDAINSMTDRCVEAAHIHQTDFDGWFTEVVPQL